MKNKYKTGQKVATQDLEQMTYTEQAKATKNIQVIPAPDDNYDFKSDAFTDARFVRKGSLLRVHGFNLAYIRFAATEAAATVPSVANIEAIETPNDWLFVVATDHFVRTSSAFMRVEVVEES